MVHLAHDAAPTSGRPALRRPAARDRHTARGFTLLELLVVLVLFGILLSVVTLNVAPDPKQALRREAERVGQLFALAADESRIRQTPIVWEADLRGYRFVTESGGERRLLTDDLLRERPWEAPLSRLAVINPTAAQPMQVLLGPGAPPVRVAIAREWVQPNWRLELSNDLATVAVNFDENGRATVAQR